MGVGISHEREEEVDMKRTFSVALVVALVVGAVPVGAQQRSAATALARVPCSAEDGPIARSARREGVRLGLTMLTERQETKPADAVSALREAARALPIGKTVEVTMLSGKKHTGKLRAAGETAVTVESKKKVVLGLPYDAMRSIERDYTLPTAAKVAIVVAAIGGFVLWLDYGWGCSGC
jgi:hypothetical protein